MKPGYHDSNSEGVSMKFSIIRRWPDNSASIEEIVNDLYKPYKYVQSEYGVSLKSKIEWGLVNYCGSSLIINAQSTPKKLEKGLDYFFKTYGFPVIIYQPNKSEFFKNHDTEKGTEIAKDILTKLGCKIKKRAFPYIGNSEFKYFVYKQKNHLLD